MTVLLSILFTIWGLLGPESIALDGNGGYFISQMGELYEADGSMIFQNKDKTEEFFKLVDPKGILLEDNILWIAENDRLIMYDTSNSNFKNYTAESGLAKYLNDIVRYKGDLYVTDTYADMVYIFKNEILEPVLTVSRPNGITTDGEYLYIISFTNPAVVYKSDGKKILETFTLQEINFGDGIVYDKENDIFFVSGFKSGNVLVYKDWKKVGEFDKLTSPADIYYDSSAKILYVPDMKTGKVIALKVEIGE
ncbi:MAG: hypothetical protein PWP54_453 [Thermosipho sp. (in: thermotogales)]|nr:hypothetical protein [Thermosipho sp. (in: thermotogales)]